METTARTTRGEGYAGPGAVKGQGAALPVYFCNRCKREVVWAESKRTGRKYLVTVSAGRAGQRFYIGSNVHTDEVCSRPMREAIAHAESQLTLAEGTLTRLRSIEAKCKDDPIAAEEIAEEIQWQVGEVAKYRAALESLQAVATD